MATIPDTQKYIDLKTEEEKLQALREKGFRMFVEDMNNGGYPESNTKLKWTQLNLKNFKRRLNSI